MTHSPLHHAPQVSANEALPEGGFEPAVLPRHLAVIMDGNGRWAAARGLPRRAGHQAGRKALKQTVEAVIRHGIPNLTVFAFSSENWRRPASEVNDLMALFLRALQREVPELHRQRIRLCFIGDRTGLAPNLKQRMHAAESLTANNDRLRLNVAINYGGRWDLWQAARRALQAAQSAGRELESTDFEQALALADLPPPDLLIRTGGEHRLSNFMLWQLAYTELYFSAVYWPDFGPPELDRALREFARRDRRYGLLPSREASTGEQQPLENHA